ncbi:hypothetical protein [Devosia geojensis]|uniref:hypothetical protein n=1 Tax=Devosia geojensis TaxID=443610 RepID=UPI000B104278|nr:hypothetical protein [Devosia geojensis]
MRIDDDRIGVAVGLVFEEADAEELERSRVRRQSDAADGRRDTQDAQAIDYAREGQLSVPIGFTGRARNAVALIWRRKARRFR